MLEGISTLYLALMKRQGVVFQNQDHIGVITKGLAPNWNHQPWNVFDSRESIDSSYEKSVLAKKILSTASGRAGS